MATTVNKPKNNSNDTYRQFFIDDSGNNRMLFKVNDKLVIITLKLKGFKARRIGVVTRSTNTLDVTRKRDKHLFRKGNSYGFNYSVITDILSSLKETRLYTQSLSQRITLAYVGYALAFLKFLFLRTWLSFFITFMILCSQIFLWQPLIKTSKSINYFFSWLSKQIIYIQI